MIERLANHIEKVLLRERCCVVPLFGGFVREDIPAHCDDKRNILIPPSSEIHFNESLNHQDGLLQQSYASTYALSMRRARLMLEDDVKELRAELIKNKSVNLKNIGKISISDRGNISFIALKSEANDCLMYGLSPVNMIGVKNKQILPIIKKDDNIQRDSRYLYLKVNKKAMNIAAAVFITVATLLPLGEITLNDRATYTAGISTNNVSHNTAKVVNEPKDKEINTNKDISINTETENINNIEVKVQEPASIYIIPNTENPYHVIIASDKNEKRLITYLEQLQKEGYNNLKILKSSSMSRIVAQSFANSSQAYAFINELKSKSNKFDTAWVYKR